MPMQHNSVSAEALVDAKRAKRLITGALALVLLSISGISGYVAAEWQARSAVFQDHTQPTPPIKPVITRPPAPVGHSYPDPGLRPLQSTADLPQIASAITEWALKHPPAPHPQITFLTNDGTYATGGLSDLTAFGGVGWLAAKIHSQWVIIYVGQAGPRCEEIAKYRLPEPFPKCH